jgi:hypothetical protein
LCSIPKMLLYVYGSIQNMKKNPKYFWSQAFQMRDIQLVSKLNGYWERQWEMDFPSGHQKSMNACYLLWNSHCRKSFKGLEKGFAKVFGKGPGSKYCLCHHGEYVKEWAWLCSNTTLFMDTEIQILYKSPLSWNAIFLQLFKNIKSIQKAFRIYKIRQLARFEL